MKHARLTLVSNKPVVEIVEDEELCECGITMPCNLSCVFGDEVQERRQHESLKLLGRMELAPGEYIHNGRVWYCADKLSS